MGVADKVQDAKAWWKSNTAIGMVLIIIPTIVKLISPELTIDAVAGTDEVFAQAGLIAEQADAAWVTLSESIGAILTALGLRKAAGGTPLKAF